MRGEENMIGATILWILIIIAILEILRYFRNLNRSVAELKAEVKNLQKLFKKETKNCMTENIERRK